MGEGVSEFKSRRDLNPSLYTSDEFLGPKNLEDNITLRISNFDKF